MSDEAARYPRYCDPPLPAFAGGQIVRQAATPLS
jgi:hypothetical protein